jgi:hypothetical protein
MFASHGFILFLPLNINIMPRKTTTKKMPSGVRAVSGYQDNQGVLHTSLVSAVTSNVQEGLKTFGGRHGFGEEDVCHGLENLDTVALRELYEILAPMAEVRIPAKKATRKRAARKRAKKTEAVTTEEVTKKVAKKKVAKKKTAAAPEAPAPAAPAAPSAPSANPFGDGGPPPPPPV